MEVAGYHLNRNAEATAKERPLAFSAASDGGSAKNGTGILHEGLGTWIFLLNPFFNFFWGRTFSF